MVAESGRIFYSSDGLGKTRTELASEAAPGVPFQNDDFAACIHFVYTLSDDVTSYLDGQIFLWNFEKARRNAVEHGVTFELAREAFFDPFVVYDDATAGDELRQSIIGRMSSPPRRLLYVVSVEREEQAIRIISARRAEPGEEDRYDNQNG